MNKYLTDPKVMKLIDQVGSYFKDLPHLPKNIVDFLVKVSPWLAGIGGVMSILSSLSMISVLLNFSPFLRFSQINFGVGPSYMVMTLLFLVSQLAMGFLLLKAFKPLKERQEIGWIYLYWVMLIGLATSLISLIFSVQSLIGTVIWLVVDLYLMFEVRSAYKK